MALEWKIIDPELKNLIEPDVVFSKITGRIGVIEGRDDIGGSAKGNKITVAEQNEIRAKYNKFFEAAWGARFIAKDKTGKAITGADMSVYEDFNAQLNEKGIGERTLQG